MLFNSFRFILLFLPVTLWVAFRLKGNALLRWITLTSLFFYSVVGKPWFLIPMLVTMAVDYFLALRLEQEPEGRRKDLMLAASVCVNLSLLFYFKYIGLLARTADAVSVAFGGSAVVPPALHAFFRVVLPAGISFYTFQSLSYIIDVYRGIAKAERNFWHYAAFISFFPHLVAGPLTRHNQLIPALEKIADEGCRPRWEEGVFLFAVGLAKKVLVADRIAAFINPALLGLSTAGAATAWLCLLGYATQLYFDFSGYSDMAVGLGRLFGIELPRNFDSPYQSRNPRDFWGRWHITLGLWLKDYLFFPLSYVFLRKGWSTTVALGLALFLTMFLGGLWHGASWTFAVFGLYHGFLLALYQTTRRKWDKFPKRLQTAVTFFLVVLGWVFFRSESFAQAGLWFARLSGAGGSGLERFSADDGRLALLLAAGALIMFKLPNANRFEGFERLPRPAVVGLGLVTVVSFLFMSYSSSFLYFNF